MAGGDEHHIAKSGHTTIDPNHVVHSAQDAKDARELAERTGYKQEMKRRWSRWALIGIVQAMAGTWGAAAASLQLDIYEGGLSAMIYGFLLVTIFNGFLAVSVAELVSAYPTSGGPYYWTGRICPPRYARFLSWIVGYLNMFSWQIVTASVCSMMATLVMGCVLIYHPEYDPPRWVMYIVYMASNLGPAVYMIFCNKTYPYIAKFMFFFTTTACLVSILMMSIGAKGHYASTKLVWATWTNETGWSNNAICFFTGLINPCYAYGLLDGTIHLCEEAENAALNVPIAIFSQILVGFVTGIAYLIAMAYSVSDIDAILASSSPNATLFVQAMGGRPGALLLQLIIMICILAALLGLQLTHARMTWAFARDDTLPFSAFFARVNRRLAIPLHAQLFGVGVVVILGFLYLFAETAFNALVGSSLVLSSLSLLIPLSAHMLTGRAVPVPGPIRMRGVVGWVVNFVSVGWLLFMIVMFNLPYFMPVVGDLANMNWTCAVIGGVFALAIGMWFIKGRKSYEVPDGVPASLEDVLDGLEVVPQAVEPAVGSEK